MTRQLIESISSDNIKMMLMSRRLKSASLPCINSGLFITFENESSSPMSLSLCCHFQHLEESVSCSANLG